MKIGHVIEVVGGGVYDQLSPHVARQEAALALQNGTHCCAVEEVEEYDFALFRQVEGALCHRQV